jgi:drug/metabolite transporter (DMT)-like permease
VLELRRPDAILKLSLRLALLLTVPPLLWAGNAVVGRLLVGQVPPLTLNFIRWLLTVLLLLPFAWRALWPLDRIIERWPYLLLLGVLGAGAYNSLQYLALVTSSPLNVTLVASSMPVWMLAVGAVCFGQRPRPAQWAGAAVGLVGVGVVISRGSLEALMQVRWVVGDIYILLAAIGWAFYSWLLAKPPTHMQGEQRPSASQGWNWAGFLLIQALFGLLAAGTLTAGEQALGAAPIQWSWSVAAALLYVALGSSIAAYRCWGLGVAEGGPALAAFFANLTPLFAALLTAQLLGESPQGYHALAFVLIVAGIGISMIQPAQPQPR